AMVAVYVVNAGDRKLYVAGGQKLDQRFVDSLVLPEDTRPRLYALDLMQTPSIQPIVEQVRKSQREATLRKAGESIHALPLKGYENNLLGVLLIANSREALNKLEWELESVGIMVALGGILLGVAMSAWATARVTRPVQRLAESAAMVAAGKWETTV